MSNSDSTTESSQGKAVRWDPTWVLWVLPLNLVRFVSNRNSSSASGRQLGTTAIAYIVLRVFSTLLTNNSKGRFIRLGMKILLKSMALKGSFSAQIGLTSFIYACMHLYVLNIILGNYKILWFIITISNIFTTFSLSFLPSFYWPAFPLPVKAITCFTHLFPSYTVCYLASTCLATITIEKYHKDTKMNDAQDFVFEYSYLGGLYP